MNYFNHISNLADLKKQYRALAIQHHPDKGGKVETMQEINAEFEKLYKIWEHRQAETTSTYTGYETDYDGATAKEYTEYVYNEYKYCGVNYKGQSNTEICNIIREWLKKTYPHYKFSVTNPHYSQITVAILKADFKPFIDQTTAYANINRYYVDKDKNLTDRGKDVVKNILGFILSYHYDDSDGRVDYFDTNFYLDISVGNHTRPFTYEPVLIGKKKKSAPKQPEGNAHKAIRLALGNAVIDDVDTRSFGKIKVLGKYSYGEKGEKYFYPLDYGGYKTAEKRMEKLRSAGIKCHFAGSMIVFQGYTEETEKALENEKQQGRGERILIPTE